MSVCATKRETERLTNRNPGHAPLQMHSSGRAGCPRIGTGPLDVWPGKQERRRNCFQTCFRRVSDVFQTCFRRVSDEFQTCFRCVSGNFRSRVRGSRISWIPGNAREESFHFHLCFTHVSLPLSWQMPEGPMCAAAHLGRRPTRDVLLEIVNRAQSRILAAQRAPIKTQGQGRGACQGVATIL